MQVEVLPAAPLPGGVKVARRPVKPLVLVRVQPWQPFHGVLSAADGPYVERKKCLHRVKGPGLQIPVGRVPSCGGSFVVVYSTRPQVRNEEHASASLATLTLSRKAGRYKLAAPVSKTGSARAEVGALPTPSAIVL